MNAKLVTDVEQIGLDEIVMKEYSLVIDGVIEIPQDNDEKTFFDGLLDAIIEYVEQHGAYAGLSMVHHEYVEDDIETNGAANGKQAT